MSIDSLMWTREVARRPYWFHVTPAEFVHAILGEGLVPGDERSHATTIGFHRPRPERVYLCTAEFTPIVECPTPRALLRVDASALDPDRIDPDEDEVQQAALAGLPWVEVPPPTRHMEGGHEAPGQDGALAEWAETTSGFDAPEVTRKSLENGRIAYHGTIAAEAIEVQHRPSRPAGQFIATIRDQASGVAEALGDAPDEDFSLIETARALALTRTVLRGAMDRVTGGVMSVADDLNPHDLQDAETALRRAAMASYEKGESLMGGFYSRATELAEQVPDLVPASMWRTNAPICKNLGHRAGRVVAALAQALGVDEAATMGAEAMVALRAARAGDVPDWL